MTTTSNIEHEYKYTVDLPKFYAWAQPFLTRGLITTRVIQQWYVPEELRNNGIMRIRQTIRGNNDIESIELTVKVPTSDPAKRQEFNFRASPDFKVMEFVEALNLWDSQVEKDRWDITRALLPRSPANGGPRPEAIVDFFTEADGTTIAMFEIENPPSNWVPPAFVVADVTADMSYTNYARAIDPKRVS